MEEMYALDLEAFKTSQLLSFSLTELVLSDLLYFDFHIDFPTEVKLNWSIGTSFLSSLHLY